MVARRWRTVAVIAAATLATLLLLAVAVVYWLLQPDRFTSMLQRQARNAGLELSLSSPASPTLFPKPALELEGITLNAKGAGMPILLAAQGRLVLPWRTLLGGPTVISRLEIDAPRVDLDALRDWLASQPSHPSSAGAQLPRIDAGVLITRGSLVRGNDLLLGNMDIESGPLQAGQPFSLNITAKDASDDPVALRLMTTPTRHDGEIALDNIRLHLSHAHVTRMDLQGQARWRSARDARAALSGTLLQGHHNDDQTSYQMALSLSPPHAGQPLTMAVTLDGPGDHVDLQLPPQALAQWWNTLTRDDAPRITLPPIQGHVQAAHLKSDGISMQGVTLDMGPDVAPASTADAPASAASVAASSPAPGKP